MIFLSKSFGVAAFAAKFLGGFPMLETLEDGDCPGRSEDLLHGLPEDISEGKITFVIQAAGDSRAVAEDPQLIAQTVAEDLSGAFRGGQVGPVEFIAVF